MQTQTSDFLSVLLAVGWVEFEPQYIDEADGVEIEMAK